MRCRTCDYRLWNLPSRQCPECGTPFRPSEYEFAANTVQFCCPHCGQAYYGTGAQGHLQPQVFDCVRCGRHIAMDDMVLLPAAGLEEEQTRVENQPWLDRTKRGAFKSWLSTVRLAMFRPDRLMELTPAEGQVGSAWWFAMFSSVLVFLVAILPALIVSLFGGGVAFIAGVAGLVAVVLVVEMVLLVVWGLITHIILRLTGPTQAGIGRTYQALGYSAGANVLTAIPCFGVYVGWIWWLISAVLMVRAGQRVHGARAAIAVLVLPALLLAGGVFGVVLAFRAASSTTLSGLGYTTSAPTQVTARETSAVGDAVLAYARDHGRRGPDHAVLLVRDGLLQSWELSTADSNTAVNDPPVGGVTLDQWDDLSDTQRQAAVDAATNALPPGTIAHRLGDFVFTYHGLTLDQCDPGLWIVVLAPDPGAKGVASLFANITVFRADRATADIGMADIPRALTAQNLLRAKHGLGPLLDPRMVRHRSPTVAPAGWATSPAPTAAEQEAERPETPPPDP